MKLKKFLISSMIAGTLSLTAKEILPEDVIIHVQTRNLTEAIQNIEAYTLESVKGTPMEMQFQPGIMKMMLPMMLGFSDGVIDMNRPVHFLVANSTLTGQDVSAILIPITDIQKVIAGSQGIKKLDDGTFKLANTHYLKPAQKGYIAFGVNQMSTSKMADIAKKWHPPVSKSNKTINIVIDIEKIIRLNSEFLKITKAEIKTDFNKLSNQSKELEGMGEMMVGLFEESQNLASQAKAIQLNFEFTKDLLKIQTKITPKQESELSTIATIYSTAKPNYKHLNNLPQNMQLTLSAHYPPEVTALLTNILKGFIEPMKSYKVVAASLSNIEKGVEIYKCIDGTSAVTMSFNPESVMKMTSYTSVKDAKEYMIQYESYMTESVIRANETYSSQNLPVVMRGDYRRSVGTVGEITYDVLKISYEVAKTDNLTPIQKAQIDGLRNLPEMSFAFCAVDSKTIASVMGNDYKEQIAKVIKNFQNDTNEENELTKQLKGLPNNQIYSGKINPIELIKGMILMQFKTLENSDQPEVAMTLKPLVDIIKNIPTSKQTIMFSSGVSNKDICSEFQIPSKTIAELVKTSMNVFIQSKMPQMNEK